MTDSSPSPQSPGTQITTASFIQIPIELAQYVRTLKLTGTQYDLWLYLYELDPYGDRWVEIPPPDQIAATLGGVSYRTIERAAQRLADCHLFDFQIERWKARNNRRSMSFPHFSLDKEIQMTTKRSKCPQMDQFVANGISLSEENKTLHTKPAQGKGSKNGHVPIVLNNCSETTEQPTHHPVSSDIDREEIGTSELIERVENAGIRLNKTIQKTIVELHRQDPAAAPRSVENALSAVAEQVLRGGVKNPGGLLVAALRQGYTSNQAKQQAKEKRPLLPPPPDLHTVEFAIDQALIQGDRPFALGKLQQLWAEGWQEQVMELCQLRQDWGFKVSAEGVRDAP